MYAQRPDDYEVFYEAFDKVVREYHKIEGDFRHVNNWDLSTKAEKLIALGCSDGVLDLARLGLESSSMRVRIGRNLCDFPLPGSMTELDRTALESKMIGAFKSMMANPEFGGQYYSLTPGNPFYINETKYQELVADHIMFKDMSNDSYLNSAGISSNWPYGRGCYVSEDKEFIVWVGEEDHLRIMCMMKGTVLNGVFDRLQNAEKIVEQYGKFARSQNYGFVTSCPTNLGTGMRASIHVKLPGLTADGTDKKAKEVCRPLGLSVRGLGGEHTPIGADGTVDISPSARLMVIFNLTSRLKKLILFARFMLESRIYWKQKTRQSIPNILLYWNILLKINSFILPYRTTRAPIQNKNDISKLNIITEASDEVMIEIEVANPFKILSAYLTYEF
jgi:ATP:guanido phosphotransferase, C-terminal catalytic domain